MKQKLLHLLNIRPDEAWVVSNLFWLQFFQGMGVAIFNVSAFTLFLEHFEVVSLSNVYIFSGFLLFITGYIYTKFEHSLHIKKLVFGVILFIAFSVLGFGLQTKYAPSNVVVFLMLSWYYVIYQLGNLEFWGVAALMFDIRQSKRLFGMIGAGDIPAKLIGYSAVPILIKITNSGNLLILSFALILVSLVFYYRLKRAGKLDLHVKHEHGKRAHAVVKENRYSSDSIVDFIKSFFGNRMIASVALLSFIIVTSVTIMSFSFYSEVKHEAHSNEQLADFIAIFYASGRALAIIIRLILTGRITNILGTKGSLLISPVILFVFAIFIISLPFYHHDPHLVLYSFGIMFILTDVLKTSLQDPVFLALMQPLPSNLRLKGHTIVKGVMDPFSYIFSGFMVYSLLAASGRVDLFLLNYVLLGLLVVWVIMIFIVDREYVKTLVTALDKRYFAGQGIDLDDDKTRKILDDVLTTGAMGDAIYALNMIEKNYTEDKDELVIKAISHSSIEVQMEAIKLAERKKIYAALPQIEAIILKGSETHLLPEAIKAKCLLLPDEIENFDVFIEHEEPRLMKAAITGMMASGGISAMVSAGQKLLHLISSKSANERKMAAEIIGELAVPSFYRPLIDLLKDENEEVVLAAISAAGKVKNEKLVAVLMQMLLHHKYEKPIFYSLYDAGDVSLNQIKYALTRVKLSRQQHAKLIALCGRIGTDSATKILDELVLDLPAMHSDIFHALHLCNFKSQPHNRKQHLELVHKYTNSAVRILFIIHSLENLKTTKVLVDALFIELHEIRDSLLILFSFLYDRDKMKRAKSAFLLNKKENIANALEVIEMEVPKDISVVFAKVYEPGSVNDKCAALRDHFKEELNYEKVMEDILYDGHYSFHRWTKAAATYSLIFYKGTSKKRWLEKVEKENDILLNETARKIIAQSN